MLDQQSESVPRPRQWSREEFERLSESEIFGDEVVHWIDGELMNSSHEPIRWTFKQYEKMDELGYLRAERVQLIDGEILIMAAANAPHAYAAMYTLYEIMRIFGGRAGSFDIRSAAAIPFLNSAPEPDISVLIGNAQINESSLSGPASVILAIEVSDTSLRYDIGEKASLYASVGIADYWVVDIPNEQVRIFRDPQPDAQQPFGFGYAIVTLHPRTDTIAPLSMPNGMILVDDLLLRP